MAGWSLYVDKGRPTYYYNYVGQKTYSLSPKGGIRLDEGDEVHLVVKFRYDGFEELEKHKGDLSGLTASDINKFLGLGGTATLYIDGTNVGDLIIEKTIPFRFSQSGETFDVGRDSYEPVTPYRVEPYEEGFPF